MEGKRNTASSIQYLLKNTHARKTRICDLSHITPVDLPALALFPDFLKRVLNIHPAHSGAHISPSLHQQYSQPGTQHIPRAITLHP